MATLDRKGRIRAVKLGMVTALLVGGLGVTTQIGSAQSIGALCDGRPASHPWLVASGQAGPTFIEGTRGDDVIIGSDGDDNIFGNGGNDIICGGPGTDNLNAGPGGDSVEEGGPGDDTLQHGGTGSTVKMNGDDGFDLCIFRAGDELINCEY